MDRITITELDPPRRGPGHEPMTHTAYCEECGRTVAMAAGRSLAEAGAREHQEAAHPTAGQQLREAIRARRPEANDIILAEKLDTADAGDAQSIVEWVRADLTRGHGAANWNDQDIDAALDHEGQTFDELVTDELGL